MDYKKKVINMSNKNDLRKQRANTIINNISKNQEKDIVLALKKVETKLTKKFVGIRLDFNKNLKLKDIVNHLKINFPDIDFCYKFDTSFIMPDGGFLNILDKNNNKYPILISEVKNQGTNDLREKEGLKKQARGNAIERLGKNVIGLRTYLLNENIFPFVCFGYGCDFEDNSSILDRVITIAMFGKLNKIYLYNQQLFNRGSFYFRREKWSINDMEDIMYKIAEKSIYYYFSKYGDENFI